MRLVPQHGAALGEIGATATGAVGISTSTTTIILIATITSTANKEVSFSTTRSIAETLLMGIGKQRTSSAEEARVALVAQDALVVLAEPVASESPAAPVALVA